MSRDDYFTKDDLNENDIFSREEKSDGKVENILTLTAEDVDKIKEGPIEDKEEPVHKKKGLFDNMYQKELEKMRKEKRLAQEREEVKQRREKTESQDVEVVKITNQNNESDELDINRKNREDYEKIMADPSKNVDDYWDKNNVFVKMFMLILLLIIVGGSVYIIMTYFFS